MSVSRPGIIPVNEEGKPLDAGSDTTFIVYVETKSNVSPEWKYAWKNDKSYTLTYSVLEKKTITAGRNKLTGEEIKVSAGDNHTLWLLQLNPTNEKITAPKNSNNELMIQAVYKKNIINQKIAEPIQLLSSPTQ